MFYTLKTAKRLNFSASNIATTTDSNVVNGILTNSANGAARITVGGADWATKSVNDIVAYSGYTAFVTSGGTNTLNYVLNGGSTLTGNVNFNTLKIASSTGSAQTLAMGNRTLGLGRSGLLLTGTDDYSITASAGGGLGDVILHQYNTGNLTLGPTAGRLEHAGTGKTILTGASSATTNNATNALMLDSGTVQFSNNNQFAGNGNLLLFSGRLVADTSGGDISLTNNSAGGFRTVALGSDVPVIDVIGGGTLTIGGLIQTNYANPNQFASPLVFGSAETNGTFVVTGNNTYNGDTRLAGGKVSINSATSLGNSTASNPSYKVVFSGNSTLNTTADITSARYLDINSGVTGTIETSANTTLTQNGTVAGAGNLNKSGAGTLTLSATNIYTGVTTISAGTLILDATGTTTCSSGVNLGTAASQGTLNLTAKSAFAFGTGQAVSGYGTINIGTGKTVTVAGNLAPCTSSPGIIGVTGGLAMSATTATTMALAGIGGTAGTDFDKISVSDGLAYAGTLSIVSFSGFNINQANTYALFNFASYTGNFNSVSVGGFGLTFDTIKTWNGTNGGNTYSFALDTGILSVVPEPSTWVLLAFSLTTAMILRRRRAI